MCAPAMAQAMGMNNSLLDDGAKIRQHWILYMLLAAVGKAARFKRRY